ncbi:putative nucleotidyltransferase [Novosphingobium chloroacetimidivorans]|uniref:Putative nucleotidyltransferase n=1 Tax=Novosphingobium chloroacetimidivorans TaxID=1428314 RepID=A0A7W7NVG5_9SPHN|nr:nucleotidyltransferase domain-containing protein [Novosphingobium chloroacetimidivorans]MBB4857284.1 putative nucleotidyltransferase [Novosphingobium chloroacetimidivorans]
MTPIALGDADLDLVRSILRAHLPGDVQVAVFGSRAGGRVKPFSDLDLVLEGPGPLSLSLLGTLADAFDESLLPIKVDLVDRLSVDESFGAIVDATKVPLRL